MHTVDFFYPLYYNDVMYDGLATILGDEMMTIWSSSIGLFESMIPVYGYLMIIYVVAGFLSWLLSLLLYAVHGQFVGAK